MSHHNCDHDHDHGGHSHGHGHGGHSHSHGGHSHNQYATLQEYHPEENNSNHNDETPKEQVIDGKVVDIKNIIKVSEVNGESVIELDEWNMWNAAAVGEFSFVEQSVSRFPFIVERVDDDGRYLLHWAALHNKLDAATSLLSARAQQVDCIAQKTGQTPLQWACTRGHIEMIHLLLKHGADVNHRDAAGANALVVATQYKEILAAHYLVKKNININMADANGCGPMHWAAYMNIIPLLRLFMSHGLDVDEKDNEGYTPLHRAVFGKCEDAALFLVENGCDINVKNRGGETAMDILRTTNFSAKVQLKLAGKGDLNASWKRFIRNPLGHPKFFQYFWVIAYSLIFFSFYTHILLWAMPVYPTMCLILGIALLGTGAAFWVVAKSDPGYVGDEAKLDFDKVLDGLEEDKQVLSDAQRICFTCNIVKPLRSKHCRFCDRCIYRFDHHCGWVGNCVGKKNHPLFLAFLLVMWIVHTFSVFLGIQAFRYADEYNDMTFLWKLWYLKVLVINICLNISGIFITGELARSHFGFMLNNETTNEVMNWGRYPHFWKPFTNKNDGRRGLAYSNPFTTTYRGNCEEFCFGVPQQEDQTMFAKMDSVRVSK